LCHDEDSYQDTQSEKDIESDITKGDACVTSEEIKNRGAFG